MKYEEFKDTPGLYRYSHNPASPVWWLSISREAAGAALGIPQICDSRVLFYQINGRLGHCTFSEGSYLHKNAEWERVDNLRLALVLNVPQPNDDG